MEAGGKAERLTAALEGLHSARLWRLGRPGPDGEGRAYCSLRGDSPAVANKVKSKG